MLLCVYPRLHQPRADLIVFQLCVYNLYNIVMYTCIINIIMYCTGIVSTIQPESGKWELENPL